MSIVEKLTEGIVNRDMKQEGAALLAKWEATGLLEGLQSDHDKANMSRLLENQAKELLREASSMGAGDVEGFAAVAFPIVRRVFAGLIANDLVSVQPMSLPSGLIFFLDFVYSPDLGNGLTQDERLGNDINKSIYGTDKVGSQITGGVNIVGATLNESLSGPRQMVGLGYGTPTGSNDGALDANASDYLPKAAFLLNGQVSDANAKLIQFDPDLLAETTHCCVVIDVKTAELVDANLGGVGGVDFENMSAFSMGNDGINAIISGSDAFSAGNQKADAAAVNTKIVRRLTQHITDTNDAATSADSVRFVLVSSNTTSFTAGDTTITNSGDDIAIGEIKYPVADSLGTTTNDAPGTISGFNFPLENNERIPEIDIKVDSIAITAQTKKLKAKWTPELGQDLNAYHNLDAEVELTSILSEQIALEIDREILADLVNGATAGTFYWSRSPGLFVNRETGLELGATSAAPDFTGTVSEWYETLIETINDVSAQIHRKTLRGGANFVVCSPEVANILEFTAGFRANVTADATQGDIGAVNVGSLSRKFDVIVDPYFPRQVILVGRRGASFLESGYVYAPYVPLQTTPTIFGVEDFVPRKGVMTRYAKKMVRPDMYGLVICRGLLGESGS